MILQSSIFWCGYTPDRTLGDTKLQAVMSLLGKILIFYRNKIILLEGFYKPIQAIHTVIIDHVHIKRCLHRFKHNIISLDSCS